MTGLEYGRVHETQAAANHNGRICFPGGSGSDVDITSSMTTHIKMEELEQPIKIFGGCEDLSENYLNALSMSSGLAIYECRDIDASPMTSSNVTTSRACYGEKVVGSRNIALEESKRMWKLIGTNSSSITPFRKLNNTVTSLAATPINDLVLRTSRGKKAVTELVPTVNTSTNVAFPQTEESCETEHDKIMRFISEYDYKTASVGDANKRSHCDGGTMSTLSPPGASVFPTWQLQQQPQQRFPSLKEVAQLPKPVTAEDHRVAYGNLSNLPTAVVVPIQRETAVVSTQTERAATFTPSNTNSNIMSEQKNALPPFETFAPTMRSSAANVNQTGYRPQDMPPTSFQQPTRYRQQVQPIKPRLQMTSMPPVLQPEVVYRQREPHRLGTTSKYEPSAADECPTLQKYLLNNNSRHPHQKHSMLLPAVCVHLPVQGWNQPFTASKPSGAVAATEVTHINSYGGNIANINSSTYLYSNSSSAGCSERFQSPQYPEVDGLTNGGMIYGGATEEIWFVDSLQRHLVQKVYHAANLPGQSASQLYAMNLSGGAVIGNVDDAKRNQMI